jgi:hypothetical protein
MAYNLQRRIASELLLHAVEVPTAIHKHLNHNDVFVVLCKRAHTSRNAFGDDNSDILLEIGFELI